MNHDQPWKCGDEAIFTIQYHFMYVYIYIVVTHQKMDID